MYRRIVLQVLLIAALMASGDAAARKPETKLSLDSAVMTLRTPKEPVKAGETFTVTLHVNINQNGDKWHIYSMKNPEEIPSLSLELPDDLKKSFELVAYKEEGAVVSNYDENFEVTTSAFYEDFDILATLKAKQDIKEGSQPIHLLFTYTTCNNKNCLPPRTFDVPMNFLGQKPVSVKIAMADAAKSVPAFSADTTQNRPPQITGLIKKDSAKTAASASGNDSAGQAVISAAPANTNGTRVPKGASVVDLANKSIWSFLLAAAGAGLIALLTPCVFPMVPITVSFFTKRNAGSRKEAVKDAVTYAGGIIVTFVALGFLLSLLSGAAGINQFAANPWANLVIAAIFILFALNLFGLFEIGLPSSVLSSLNNTARKSKNRYLSVAMMGLVFSLTSFTCTVPFVGTLMVAFTHGAWFVPLLGMLIFASIFALPFFVLALFPSAMKSLPRSGAWLNSVKVVMGFIEIAAALKFLSNVDLIWQWEFFSRDLVLAIWIAIAILVTFYLLGRFQLSHDTAVEHIGAIRVMLAVMFLSIGVYLWTGFHGRPLGQIDAYLPPDELQEASLLPAVNRSANLREEWIPRYSEALAEAKRTGKNIFIDFTGYTCTNCRAMEKTIFAREDVKSIFQGFVLARLYTDNGSPLNDSNRAMEEERFRTIALPYYAIVSPEDKPLSTFDGFTTDAEAFKSFLRMHSAVSVAARAAAAPSMLAEQSGSR